MNKDIDAQFLCKDCERYNLCKYYHSRKEDSYICKYFHITETDGMTNGEVIQNVFSCEVCEPIIEDDIIHVIFADKKDSAIGFDWSWWNAPYKAESEGRNGTD